MRIIRGTVCYNKVDGNAEHRGDVAESNLGIASAWA
jgi:hypothetical protein